MLIAVAATPKVALPTLEALVLSSHHLGRVITQPDRRAGRGLSLRQSEVGNWAEERGIPIAKPQSDQELRKYVSDVELVITIGYGKLIPEAILEIPKFGFINLHFSALPRWRGAAPVQRAIESADRTIGLTVFKLDKGMDTGPIYIQREFPLSHEVSTGEIWNQLAQAGAPLILQTVTLIEQGVSPHPQASSGATRAEKITKEEAFISWNQPGEVILRKIRAFNPTPFSWTLFRGEPVKVLSARLHSRFISPGEIVSEKNRIYVGTSSEALEIVEVIPSGKKVMSAAAWVRGLQLREGERFGA